MLYNFNYDKYKLQFHEAKPSQAKPSQAFTLNFLKFYVYLLIIKTIIFIWNSYLVKSFIQLNVFINYFY